MTDRELLRTVPTMPSTLLRPPAGTARQRTSVVAHALLGSADALCRNVVPLTEGRSYERLLELPDVEAWLIRWAPGAGLDLHDHGGSSATVAVLQGALVERHRDGGGGRLHTRVLHSGDAVSFGAEHAHAVANRGLITAASLHVYSPPLAEMRFPDSGLHLDAGSPGWAAAEVLS